jgi:hypothetical protein
MPASDQGFHSESLRVALKDAVAGRPAELERLLMQLGAVVTGKPNTKLAAAFGTEVAGLSPAVVRLLRRLAADDAAPDTDRAFLPIVAAHGWAARLRAGHDIEEAWGALAELAGDERAPVRLGTREALVALGMRDGGADELVTRALSWLELPDRELSFGAVALVLEALAERTLVAGVRDQEALLQFLSGAVAAAADAPRSAERSDARRRLLLALPAALASVVANPASAREAQPWFRQVCQGAVRPDVREALSSALLRLRSPAYRVTAGVVEDLRAVLSGSAKPLRDPTRLRPGAGRGKASRRIR